MYKIRYTKLYFKLEMLEENVLPYYKVSAIRGGMGQILLMQNCFGEQKCDICSFHSKCVVQNIMYAPCKIKPPYMTNSESMGYTIDCLDYKIRCSRGDILTVTFTLFGDAICYILPVIYALTSLGNVGLGKDKARFRIQSIYNRKHIPILKNNNICMSNVLVELVGDYVKERFNHRKNFNESVDILFQSPCAVKYRGEVVHTFDEHSIVLAALQKLQMYNMYEGNEIEKVVISEEEFPIVIKQDLKEKVVYRYSSTQDRKMGLRGMQGTITLEKCSEYILKIFYAAEILHIGKNTRLGFGKIKIL